MATQYHVYKNDGAGGPIDYSTPIATTAGLTYATSPVPVGSDVSFAVRAYDTVTGLEELNTDAVVRLVTDGVGVDRTNRPRPPVGLSARATAGGTARVEWTVSNGPRETTPAGWRVWVTPSPGPIDYTAMPTVTLTDGSKRSASITGLSDGVTYLVAVRAVNGNGDDGGTGTVTVVGSSVGPAAVDGLVAVLV